MEDNVSKRKTRPAQKLYVPPAQRNQTKTKKCENNSEKLSNESETEHNKPQTKVSELSTNETNGISCCHTAEIEVALANKTDIKQTGDLTDDDDNKSKNSTNNELVLMFKDLKTGPDKYELEVDKEKEEVKRDIHNVNKKNKPLIKHINKNDVLHIDVKHISNKSNKKSPVKLVQVANWEDLFLEEDQEDSYNNQLEIGGENLSDCEHEDSVVSPKMQELEHVIELYDFPSTFKTQDIMQIYSDINKESMYIKWCDETHALLVLGSLIQAQRALGLQHDIIKSRPMTMAGSIAMQVAAKCDLRPAMKRPETSMHAARRMITTALGVGAKNLISREVQEREREALRKAKELKRAQRQNERDAWEGNPRPSTA